MALDTYFQPRRTQEPAIGPVHQQEPSGVLGNSQHHSSDEALEVSDPGSSTTEEEEVEAAAPQLPSTQENPSAAGSGGLCYI